MAKSKFFKKQKTVDKTQHIPIQKNKSLVFPIATGGFIGASISPVLKKFYDVEIIPGLPFGIGRAPVFVPLTVGSGSLIAGTLSHDEFLSPFLVALGAASLATGVCELVLNQLNVRNQRLQRPMTMNRPIVPQFVNRPRPMIASQSRSQTVNPNTPRSSKTSEETATKIKNYTIWA